MIDWIDVCTNTQSISKWKGRRSWGAWIPAKDNWIDHLNSKINNLPGGWVKFEQTLTNSWSNSCLELSKQNCSKLRINHQSMTRLTGKSVQAQERHINRDGNNHEIWSSELYSQFTKGMNTHIVILRHARYQSCVVHPNRRIKKHNNKKKT